MGILKLVVSFFSSKCVLDLGPPGKTLNVLEGLYVPSGLGTPWHPKNELEGLDGERDVWVSLLDPLPLFWSTESNYYSPNLIEFGLVCPFCIINFPLGHCFSSILPHI
ncbi:hypothetical protein ILYODFUR_037081 [Ilyodon furcidens]|uniref:Uncharacterized protein n=1 Tax=Ilyodon furcidens TaxID=33524 RepID=A0ABV0T3J7_9TELE